MTTWRIWVSIEVKLGKWGTDLPPILSAVLNVFYISIDRNVPRCLSYILLLSQKWGLIQCPGHPEKIHLVFVTRSIHSPSPTPFDMVPSVCPQQALGSNSVTSRLAKSDADIRIAHPIIWALDTVLPCRVEIERTRDRSSWDADLCLATCIDGQLSRQRYVVIPYLTNNGLQIILRWKALKSWQCL